VVCLESISQQNVKTISGVASTVLAGIAELVGVRRRVASIMSRYILVDCLLYLGGAAVRTPHFE
ncbi:hypothetical protein CABS01_16420, partial [Colletotrichum abscissum]|uniref:uncharacterized protein n=1 Tax=Colletotrichum abscissum TaxID=1671311 RepID=UPI0027D4DB34